MSPTAYRVRPDVRFRLVREEAVVLKQDEGETLVLNEVASRILQLLDGQRTISEVAEALLAEFEVGQEEILEDVTHFTRELVEAGVVEPVGER